MDRQGIDLQVLSVPPSEYFYWLDAEHARGSAVQHERFAEVVAAHPGRFAAVANLPMDHPELAVEVLREATGDLGFPGFELSADVVGKELDDRRYDVVWEAAVELGMTAILHPQGFTHGERISDYYLVNVMCMPLASTFAVTRMILGGVWRRHPALPMVVVHGGGYLPFYSARTDHAFAVRPELRAHIDRLPERLPRSLHFDTNVFDPAWSRTGRAVRRRARAARHRLPLRHGDHRPAGIPGELPLSDRERELVLGGRRRGCSCGQRSGPVDVQLGQREPRPGRGQRQRDDLVGLRRQVGGHVDLHHHAGQVRGRPSPAGRSATASRKCIVSRSIGPA